jgi:hypothetical protein
MWEAVKSGRIGRGEFSSRVIGTAIPVDPELIFHHCLRLQDVFEMGRQAQAHSEWSP